MRNKPRAAHLIHDDGLGGGAVVVATMLRQLCGAFDMRVYHGGRGEIARTCDAMSITHVQMPIQNRGTCAWGAWRLYHQLRRDRPDVLILHGQWAGVLGAVVARWAGVRRLIYVAHWPAFYTDWDLFRVIRNYLCERAPCRYARRVVALSESSRYQYLYRGWVDESRLLVVPNPIDAGLRPTPDQVALSRRVMGGDHCGCCVVFVGRLAIEKRVDWLLRSWQTVHREEPCARLWIVGDGEERARLEHLAANLRLGDSCTFLGARSPGIAFVNAADIVVLSSLYEAHPVVVLEAMLCGRPIVATGSDGIRDTVDHGQSGFLVRPGDTEAFAARVVELIRNPALRQTMGTYAQQAAKRFDARAVSSRFRALVDEVLAE